MGAHVRPCRAAGRGLKPRTLERPESRLFRRVCVELRLHAGYPEPVQEAITAGELEYIWQLHGRLFYWNLRRDVYGLADRVPVQAAIETMMDDLFEGCPVVLAR